MEPVSIVSPLADPFVGQEIVWLITEFFNSVPLVLPLRVMVFGG